jgi:sterol desaturase/sphingolipid hydroxylase (fatty acid hydroxylase superfamily)
LFHNLAWDLPVIGIVAIVVLDFKHYLFHRLVHRIGWMWQFHRVHHSDLDCDVTTGVWSYPFETILALLLHCTVVVCLGIPIAVLLFYEVLATASQFFAHGNMSLNATPDHMLRFVFVTPSMHRIHHSENIAEGNTNFGALFTVWDRLFRTYQEKPLLGQDHMVFGLSEYRTIDALGLRGLLSMPFAKAVPNPPTLTCPLSSFSERGS